METYTECPGCKAKIKTPTTAETMHFECGSYIKLKEGIAGFNQSKDCLIKYLSTQVIYTDKNEDYVAIKQMSAGNESVGSMWEETLVVKKDTTVEEIMKWAMGSSNLTEDHSRVKLILTKAHCEKTGKTEELPF